MHELLTTKASRSNLNSVDDSNTRASGIRQKNEERGVTKATGFRLLSPEMKWDSDRSCPANHKDTPNACGHYPFAGRFETLAFAA
jgi:hypothetical protein